MAQTTSSPLAKRHLAAIWFADIVAYSRLTSENEKAALKLVRIFQATANRTVRRYRGRIVKFVGDAALAEFPSTEAAVRAAQRFRNNFVGDTSRTDLGAQDLRIGVHVGDIAMTEDGDVYGDGVNVAARLQADAEPGQVLVTEDIWRQLRRRPQFEFKALGEREFKNIPAPVGVYGAVVDEADDEEFVAGLGEERPPGLRGVMFELRHRPKLGLAAAFGALLLLTGVGLGTRYVLQGNQLAAIGGLDPNRLAVLYFDDLSPSGDLDYMAAGLTEALINELGNVEALDVISPNGVQPYRETDVSSDSIAQALGVGTVVEGSVAESQGRLRVNVQLVNGNNGSQLMSKTLERPTGELFQLQDDLAFEVSSFLRQRLGEEVRLRDVRKETNSVEAWELVQQAQELMKEAEPLRDAGQVGPATELYERADSLLAHAAEQDSDWSEPIVRRALVDFELAWLNAGPDESAAIRHIEEGLVHADRALELEPDDPDGLEARASLRYLGYLLNMEPDARESTRLLAAAESDFRAAVEANPRQAGAWAMLSHLLVNRDAKGAAKIAARRAYEADAYLSSADVILERLSLISYDLNDPTEARHWCEVGQRRFPEDPRFVECQLWLMTMDSEEPDVERAWELYGRFDQLSVGEEADRAQRIAQMIVAAVIARAGLADSARAVAVRARADATVDPTRDLMYFEAFVRTLLGDEDEAVELLANHLATNPEAVAQMMTTDDWWFDELEDHPGYRALLAD